MTPYSINKNVRYTVYICIFFIGAFIKELVVPYVGGGSVGSRAGAEGLATASIIASLFFLFDKFVWQWLGKARLVVVPDFTGRWYGYILDRLSFEKLDAPGSRQASEAPLPVKVVIEQTFSEIGMWLHEAPHGSTALTSLRINDESMCTMAAIDMNSSIRPRLRYTFKMGALAGSGRLVMQSDRDVVRLDGAYFSDYPRKAKMTLRKIGRKTTSLYLGQIGVLEAFDSQQYVGVIIEKTAMIREQQLLVKKSRASDIETMIGLRERRDGNEYHMTIVEPGEWSKLSQQHKDLCLSRFCGNLIWIECQGIGRAAKGSDQAYFAIAESSLAQDLRDCLKLPKKDLHITLGFAQSDVHGTPKDYSTRL